MMMDHRARCCPVAMSWGYTVFFSRRPEHYSLLLYFLASSTETKLMMRSITIAHFHSTLGTRQAPRSKLTLKISIVESASHDKTTVEYVDTKANQSIGGYFQQKGRSKTRNTATKGWLQRVPDFWLCRRRLQRRRRLGCCTAAHQLAGPPAALRP